MESGPTSDTLLLGSVTGDLAAGGAAPGSPAETAQVRRARLERLLGMDERLLLGLLRWRKPWRTRLAHAFTRAGDASSWTIAGIGLIATGSPLGVHLGLRLGAASLLATGAGQVLKRSLTRARPNSAIEGFVALAENPDAFSFPSGHTAAAFGVAVAFAGEPHALGPLALLFATGVGLSRVYLGAHYPLDVAAGAVLGAISGLVARLVVP